MSGKHAQSPRKRKEQRRNRRQNDSSIANPANLHNPASSTNSPTFGNPVIQGHYSQASITKFQSTAGKQCTAMCLSALAYTEHRNIALWNSNDIDTILNHGDMLYQQALLHNNILQERCLQVNELPPQIHSVNHHDLSVSILDDRVAVGIINQDNANNPYGMETLQNHLQTSFADSKGLILVLNEYSVLLVRNSAHSYFMFDSHSRSNEGLLSDNGKAVLLQFPNVIEMYHHIIRLCASLNLFRAILQFEITPVLITETQQYPELANISGRESHVERVTEKQTNKRKTRNQNCKKPNNDTTSKKPKSNSTTQNNPPTTQKRKSTSTTEKNNAKSKTRKKDKSEHPMTNTKKLVAEFHEKCKNGPTYPCTVCNRLLFKKTVVKFSIDNYTATGLSHSNADLCRTQAYVHTKLATCDASCALCKSCLIHEYICTTCHKYLKRGEMPGIAVSNNNFVDDIPMEIVDLNDLEKSLIAKIIIFIRVVPQYKAAQHTLHGASICIPANTSKIQQINPVTNLPNPNHFIKLQLKRKLCYNRVEKKDCVSLDKIKAALLYLKNNNRHFEDIVVDEAWLNEATDGLTGEDLADNISVDHSCNQQHGINNEDRNIESSEGPNDIHNDSVETDGVSPASQSDADHSSDGRELPSQESSIYDRQTTNYLPSAYMPADFSAVPEIVNNIYEDLLYSIAPGEGQRPVSYANDPTIELKAFPYLFPKGRYGFNYPRPVKISKSKYFSSKLVSADTRFAKSTEYLFFAQYEVECENIRSSMSIALRQYPGQTQGQQITREMLRNPNHIQELVNNDKAYKFLKQIRGTPSYYQSVMKRLFASIKQLGIPTFFFTVSSYEQEIGILNVLALQQGIVIDMERLTSQEKTSLLKSNPVTVARMLNEKFQILMKDVIKSKEMPVGKVVADFSRAEFQARGSVHWHCLLWVDQSPKYQAGTDSEAVCAFIDRYITAMLPCDDEDLKALVLKVQTHSKRHTASCKISSGRPCRYGFPKKCSDKTIITQFPSELFPNMTREELEEKETHAKIKLLEICRILLNVADGENPSISDILESVELQQEEYTEILSLCSNKEEVIYKRGSGDLWTNQFNRTILLAARTNTDLQFCLNAYSVIVYILSYVTKAESAMSDLLKEVLRQSQTEGSDIKAQMRKVSNTYLSHREISSQEATFRLLGLPLTQFSKGSIFIPAHHSCTKMSMPLANLQNPMQSNQNPWMTSFVDRYIARPNLPHFNVMCMALFAAEYRVENSKCENGAQPVIQEGKKYRLQKGLGVIVKRHLNRAVITYPNFNKHKKTEDYFEVLLKLYVPFRYVNQLKPPAFETYQNFYNSGYVMLENTPDLQKVSTIVKTNHMDVEPFATLIDDMEDLNDNNFNLIDAWAAMIPNIEQERQDCLQERIEMNIDPEDTLCIPDADTDNTIHRNRSENSRNTDMQAVNFTTQQVHVVDIQPLLQSMNSDQQNIFYFIRHWCKQKRELFSVEPWYIFMTGSGGTGKSLTVKCIVSEVKKLLESLRDNGEEEVISVVAPTGIAAHNVCGQTIHSVFRIPLKLTLPIKMLTEGIANTLRAKYHKLSILIIDEISMVSTRLLSYIDVRLQQIKGCSQPFGRTSVLACGDLYQLPPVVGYPMYIANTPLTDFDFVHYFHLTTLEKVMRQDDRTFVEFLGRMRTHKRNDQLHPNDIALIQARSQHTPPEEVLHIFSTNKKVDAFNNYMLEKKCSDIREITCEDFICKNKQMFKKDKPITTLKDCLPTSVRLAVNARVMITRNLSVENGIVNSSLGTIEKFIEDQNSNFPKAICVKLDDIGVPPTFEQPNFSGIPHGTVAILPYDEQFHNGQILRRQYCLRLAWGTTIHKVQGLTLDQIVISLENIFASGQAYVALSRCRSLQGLYITHFKTTDKDKSGGIYCNNEVPQFLERLTKCDFSQIQPFHEHANPQALSVIHFNVEGLINHFQPIQNTDQLSRATVFIASETWLTLNNSEIPVLPSYESYHRFRSQCSFYSNSSHGGVSIFVKSTVKWVPLELPAIQHIECAVISLPDHSCAIVGAYRAPTYPITEFAKHLETILLDPIFNRHRIKIVTGDLNENLMLRQRHTLHNLMLAYGFQQQIKETTTAGNTLLDVIYVSSTTNLKAGVLQTYFSYHEPVYLIFE